MVGSHGHAIAKSFGSRPTGRIQLGVEGDAVSGFAAPTALEAWANQRKRLSNECFFDENVYGVDQ